MRSVRFVLAAMLIAFMVLSGDPSLAGSTDPDRLKIERLSERVMVLPAYEGRPP